MKNTPFGPIFVLLVRQAFTPNEHFAKELCQQQHFLIFKLKFARLREWKERFIEKGLIHWSAMKILQEHTAHNYIWCLFLQPDAIPINLWDASDTQQKCAKALHKVNSKQNFSVINQQKTYKKRAIKLEQTSLLMGKIEGNLLFFWWFI